MTRRRTVALAIAISAFAASASAQTRICNGDAKGPSDSSVIVTIAIDEAGKAGPARMRWSPPHRGPSPMPGLVVGYHLDGDRPGAVEAVMMVAMATLDPMPRSAHADMVVSIGDWTWKRPWQTYASSMAQIHSGHDPVKIPKGAKGVGFWGMVPMALEARADQPAVNPELIAALAKAGAVEVAVVGDQAGERLWENSLDLSDIAARDALLGDALAKARQAAQAPAACPKAG